MTNMTFMIKSPIDFDRCARWVEANMKQKYLRKEHCLEWLGAASCSDVIEKEIDSRGFPANRSKTARNVFAGDVRFGKADV
jgi:hypothetical protein